MKQATLQYWLAGSLACGIAACSGSAATKPDATSVVTTITNASAPAPLPDIAAPARQPEPIRPQRASAAFTDPEIAGVIDAASVVEERLARQALKRSLDQRVRQLAQRVISGHDEAKLERVERLALVSPRESSTSTALSANGASVTLSLQESSVEDFDRLFLDALSNAEHQLVELLDDEMIPQARGMELRTLLQDVRASMASRIAMVEDIRSSRGR
jgi:predicted outer membrane protein